MPSEAAFVQASLYKGENIWLVILNYNENVLYNINTCSIQDSKVLYRGPSINNWVAIRQTCEGKCSKVCI